MRVGIGYDIHKLVTRRKLVLGGIRIPYSKGLSGYSDADVLAHAVMDALLGAAGLRDIGFYFPPGDPQYKDISSMELMKRVRTKVAEGGYRIGNIDAVIIAESPRLSDFIEEMRMNIGAALETGKDRITVKVTTNEGLDAIGSKKGIAVFATALLE